MPDDNSNSSFPFPLPPPMPLPPQMTSAQATGDSKGKKQNVTQQTSQAKTPPPSPSEDKNVVEKEFLGVDPNLVRSETVLSFGENSGVIENFGLSKPSGIPFDAASLSMSDLVFVLHGLNNGAMTMQNAPSAAAWSLLQLARTRKGFDVEFVKSFVKPLYDRLSKEEERKRLRFDDGRDLTGFMERVRAARLKAIRDGDEDAIRALGTRVFKERGGGEQRMTQTAPAINPTAKID